MASIHAVANRFPSQLGLTACLLALCSGAPASAQDPADRRPPPRPVPSSEGRDVDEQVDPQAPLPPDFDRPPRKYPNRFDMRAQFQRDRFGYRMGIPAFEEERRRAVERAYREGLEEGRHNERLEIQAERGLGAYAEAMAAGQAAFADSDYGLAARQFLLAAALHQGDPSARLCAAHAHIALEDYGPAFRLIERAIELEPRIVFLPLDLRGAYGERNDFHRHLRALQDAADGAPDDGELWFLLGYCRYFSGNLKESVAPLTRAAERMPDEALVARMAELAKTVSGKSEKKPVAKP